MKSIYVIQIGLNYWDRDGHREYDHWGYDDETFFTNIESANLRCAELNKEQEKSYRDYVSKMRKEHEKETQKAELHNKEAKALRDAGFVKEDVHVPEPFESVSFNDYCDRSDYVEYEVVELHQSELDNKQ